MKRRFSRILSWILSGMVVMLGKALLMTIDGDCSGAGCGRGRTRVGHRVTVSGTVSTPRGVRQRHRGMENDRVRANKYCGAHKETRGCGPQSGWCSLTSHRRVKRDEAIRWFLPCATAVLCGIEHYDPMTTASPYPLPLVVAASASTCSCLCERT
jgi:hypothetical protein